VSEGFAAGASDLSAGVAAVSQPLITIWKSGSARAGWR
jgi:hypothetical protein